MNNTQNKNDDVYTLIVITQDGKCILDDNGKFLTFTTRDDIHLEECVMLFKQQYRAFCVAKFDDIILVMSTNKDGKDVDPILNAETINKFKNNVQPTNVKVW